MSLTAAIDIFAFGKFVLRFFFMQRWSKTKAELKLPVSFNLKVQTTEYIISIMVYHKFATHGHTANQASQNVGSDSTK